MMDEILTAVCVILNFNMYYEKDHTEFSKKLTTKLIQKFQGHWYEENPERGSAFRCIHMDPIDPLLKDVAKETGHDINEMFKNVDLRDMIIFINPGEICIKSISNNVVLKKVNGMFELKK